MTQQTRHTPIEKTSPRTMRVEREFDAPRDLVFRAMTEPDLVAQWWGRGNPLTVERLEPEAGGHWRFVEHSEGQDHGFEGRFREVRPPEFISMTFGWDGMPGYFHVQDMTLTELPDGRTRMVAESMFMTEQELDGMLQYGAEAGMNESYAALDRLLAGLAKE